jgi:hypothetical protein
VAAASQQIPPHDEACRDWQGTSKKALIPRGQLVDAAAVAGTVTEGATATRHLSESGGERGHSKRMPNSGPLITGTTDPEIARSCGGRRLRGKRTSGGAKSRTSGGEKSSSSKARKCSWSLDIASIYYQSVHRSLVQVSPLRTITRLVSDTAPPPALVLLLVLILIAHTWQAINQQLRRHASALRCGL